MRAISFRLAGAMLAVCSHAVVCFAADQSPGSAATDGTASSDKRWFFRAGPTGLLFDSSALIDLGGKKLAGASLTASNNATLILEGGYFVTPNIAVESSGGVPPKTIFTGKGSIAGLGELGKATYGPTVLGVNPHWRDQGITTSMPQ